VTAPIDPAEFGIENFRAKAEESLHRILQLDEQIKALQEEREMLKDGVKMELSSDRTPIIDGERGIVATLRERKKPASIDLVSMSKKMGAEKHIIEAARTGILNASLTPLRALRGKSASVDAMLKYEMPSGVTEILVIEQTK